MEAGKKNSSSSQPQQQQIGIFSTPERIERARGIFFRIRSGEIHDPPSTYICYNELLSDFFLEGRIPLNNCFKSMLDNAILVLANFERELRERERAERRRRRRQRIRNMKIGLGKKRRRDRE